ncbi:MAG: energy-coupling factor transporter transmembrane protein EcfT [Bifidobacteriaceae bacterium]|nr:energy-coupling factor transporter transmembrane protein EcfT [Bifidobacteriaceae bacterium]
MQYSKRTTNWQREPSVHPVAWWAWALAFALVANWTTNPLLLALLCSGTALVVAMRRGATPWGRAWGTYIGLAAAVLLLRLVYRVVFASQAGSGHVLLNLPTWQGPGPFRMLRLLGPLTAEGLYGGFCDGLRLAALILTVGAACCLADPRRLLAAAPPALHETGSVLVIALAVLPALGSAVLRVRRAQVLRGAPKRHLHPIKMIALPVLAEALDRALVLAAAMESRGHGLAKPLPSRQRRLASVAAMAGLAAAAGGVLVVISRGGSSWPGWLAVLLGLVCLAWAGHLLGRRVQVSQYRPVKAVLSDWLVGACGWLAPLGLLVTRRFDAAAVTAGSLPPPPLPAVAALSIGLALTGVLLASYRRGQNQ